jgi:hypothetical protein
MQFDVTLEETDSGDYLASCPDMGAQARCLSAQCALDMLRDELRYRLEWCPCLCVEEEEIDMRVI